MQSIKHSFQVGTFSQAGLDSVAWKLNTRSRKSLGFKCSVEFFILDIDNF